MPQLKLTLPQSDIDQIRRLAHERGLSTSVYLREAALGEAEVELAPESVGRLDAFERRLSEFTSWGSDLGRDLNSLAARLSALERSTDRVDALDQRVSRVEELAGL